MSSKHEMSQSEEGVRRSERSNKGKPPSKLKEFELNSIQEEMDEEEVESLRSNKSILADVQSNVSQSSKHSKASSKSVTTRKLIEDFKSRKEELKMEEEVDLFDRTILLKQLERRKELNQLKLKLKHAVIEEEEEGEDRKDNPPSITSPTRLNDWIKNQDPRHIVTPPVSPPKSHQSTTPPVSSRNSHRSIPPTVSTLNSHQSALPVVQTSLMPPNPYFFRQPPDLPNFSGEIMEWPLFIANFKQSTEKYAISNLDNIGRLQKCLKGKARTAVLHDMIDPEMLDEIMDTLRWKFGRPTVIIENCLEEIKKFPIIRERQYEILMDYSTIISNTTATIKSLKKPSYLHNDILLKEIVNKLPTSLHMRWFEDLDPDDEVNLDSLNQWLKKKARALVLASTPTLASAVAKSEQFRKPRQLVFQASEKAEEPNLGKYTVPKKLIKCSFCAQDGHKIYSCAQFAKEPLYNRKDFARSHKLCFGCCNVNHVMADCKSKKECTHDGCTKLVHKLLHGHPKVTISHSSRDQVNSVKSDKVLLTNQIACQVVPITVKGPNNTQKHIYALLDTGSTLTLIDEKLCKDLNLPGKDKPLTFSTLTGPTTLPSKEVSVTLINLSTKAEFKLASVRSHPHLQVTGGTVTKSQLNKWPHLKELNLPTYENCHPQMLIGLPHADLITPFKVCKLYKNSPVAAQTKLGWSVFGNLSIPEGAEVTNQINHLKNSNDFLSSPGDTNQSLESKLHKLVEDYFSMDSLGVTPLKEEILSSDEKKAQYIANSTLRKVNGRYEVGLLWKDPDIILPDSRRMALKRLYSQERKMDLNPDYAKKYSKNIQHYIDSGYLRKLAPSELKVNSPRKWYLPHFSAVNPNKPEKLRMVFDAAALSNGTSFNENLLPGPDILKPLPSIISMFRERRIGITADIKEMFHQVRIRKEDQDSQRVLWRGMERDRDPDEYVMTVMTFGSTCSPYCAQFAKNSNAQEFQKQYPEASEAIINKHYVDDLLCSVDTLGEAKKLYCDICEVHQQGGFYICNWVTNSPDLIQTIPAERRSKSQKKFTGKESLSSEKVLGLIWNPPEDCFQFNTKFAKVKPVIIEGEEIPTRREVLSTIMSVYDPLGFASNLNIKAKILLQKCWRLGIGWDDPITDALFNIWKSWLQELKTITQFKIPRCYSSSFSSAEEIQLHMFCDASDQAFGCVAYFRISSCKLFHTSLVASKSKVHPIKQTFKEGLSIPRAELQAALLGVRLGKSVIEWHSIKPTKKFFWSDNTTVLSWLKFEPHKLKQFVSNRVAEILNFSTIDEWRYVLTSENVADDVTKDHLPISWDSNSRWLKGPPFLMLPEKEWPNVRNDNGNREREVTHEIKKEFIGHVFNSFLIPITNFSSWNRLIRVTAIVFRAIKLFRKDSTAVKTPYVSLEERRHVQLYYFASIQQHSFDDLIQAIQSHSPTPVIYKIQKNHGLHKMSIFIDEDGILKMKGRIQTGKEIHFRRNPIILSASHHCTKLIIKLAHEENCHQGTAQVINLLKFTYVILGLREAVRKIVHDCQFCKNRRAKPMPPEMAPIPPCRLASFQCPFTYTGVDYFGPMEVTIGRRHEKRYGALFTCLTSRAIHIELAVDLSTDAFINAFRRFISERGSPKEMFSDNGTNFVGAEVELNKAITDLYHQTNLVFHTFLTHKEIVWNFIVPHAPHMGGCWERMVRSVKSVLRFTLNERAPKEDTLRTLLKEAQMIVNSHPLGYVNADAGSDEVLTPNHLLRGTPSLSQAPGIFTDRDLLLSKQWKIAQRLADLFWKRWTKEILPILNTRQKWTQPQKPLEVGDLVILIDDDLPRNCWAKGRVTEIPVSKDGQTRWAWIKIGKSILRRPTVKLIILDVIKPEEDTTPSIPCPPTQPQVPRKKKFRK